jgi:hypothetical protein
VQLSAVPKHPLQLALQEIHLKVELLKKVPPTHEVHLDPEQVKQPIFALHRRHEPNIGSKTNPGLQHDFDVLDLFRQAPFYGHRLLVQEVQLLEEPEHVKQLELHS